MRVSQRNLSADRYQGGKPEAWLSEISLGENFLGGFEDELGDFERSSSGLNVTGWLAKEVRAIELVAPVEDGQLSRLNAIETICAL
jgi:hypothetical protein